MHSLEVEHRFLLKIKVDLYTGCWNWTGKVTREGYGHASIGNAKTTQAHRVSYEIHCWPIPEGLHIDHLCRNRRCVNPFHLEAVTVRENICRAIERTKKGKCKHGHVLEEVGYYLVHGGKHKVCKPCSKRWREEALARKSAE